MRIRVCYHCIGQAVSNGLAVLQLLLAFVERFLAAHIGSGGTLGHDAAKHDRFIEFEIQAHTVHGQAKASLPEALFEKSKTFVPAALPSAFAFPRSLYRIPGATLPGLLLYPRIARLHETVQAYLAAVGSYRVNVVICSQIVPPIPERVHNALRRFGYAQDASLIGILKHANAALLCNTEATPRLLEDEIQFTYARSYIGQLNGQSVDRSLILANLLDLKEGWSNIQIRYKTIENVGREVAAVEEIRFLSAEGRKQRALATRILTFGDAGTPDEHKIVRSHELFNLL